MNSSKLQYPIIDRIVKIDYYDIVQPMPNNTGRFLCYQSDWSYGNREKVDDIIKWHNELSSFPHIDTLGMCL